jgi:hypothetical protein
VRVVPLKLSWKKWISNFSSSTTSAILLQYALRWVIGHWVPGPATGPNKWPGWAQQHACANARVLLRCASELKFTCIV